MTLPEAEKIVALDLDGKLDRSDRDVAKIVFEAHTIVQRASLWGAGPGTPSRRRGMLIFFGAAIFIAVWIAGLLIPLLLGLEQ
ncbi:hypothetical protein C8E83_0074 [Frondihabitans australicus]|uniref:Uncharacterized protein n=2 Tax=Frondihabitans australicus TaxID=386892 RepID=A0A495IAQ3_9MICO|nr:hypothetical protein C8E83_0074 [Frondihabitans australicus]